MRNLSVKVTRGVTAPHKAIMLISIIDLIKENKITSNAILPNETIAGTFKKNWNRFADNKREFSIFKCSIWTPYWHMKNEPFWHFQTFDSKFNVDSIVPAGQTASIGAIRKHIRYAYLDSNLWELLQDQESREKIRQILIDTYKLQPIEDTPSVINDSSMSSFENLNTDTDVISIIIDKRYKNQIVDQILKLDGVIKIVQKTAPVIFAISLTSKLNIASLLVA